MGIQELPIELLYVIFDLGASPFVEQLEEGYQHPSRWRDTFTPSHMRFIFRHYLLLSQVSATWRSILLEYGKAWAYVHLGRCAFVSRQFMSIDILARSAKHPLRLECVFSQVSPLTPKPKPEAMKAFFAPHIDRIRSLRVAGPDTFISAILDIFIDRTLSASPSPSNPLIHLHIIQTYPQSGWVFPLELKLVAPRLTHLVVFGADIAHFPRWHLQKVVLEGGTFLPSKNHHEIFHNTPTRTLILDKIYIAGTPSIIGVRLTPFMSSITSLVLDGLQTFESNAESKTSLFASFISLSLPKSLRDLKLANLSDEAVKGLMLVLESVPAPYPPLYPELRRLGIEKLQFRSRSACVTLAKVFSEIQSLELLEVTEDKTIFLDVWRSGGETGDSIWPLLDEIIIDGTAVQRPLIGGT